MSKQPLDPDDYPSDSDESDEDYRPEGAGSNHSASEIESDDHIEDDPGEDEENPKGKKRKKTQRKAGNKKKLVNKGAANVGQEEVEKENENKEDEKEKVDALWADFLESTGSESSKPEPRKEVKKNIGENPKKLVVVEIKEKESLKIFDFAGETVTVTKATNGQSQLISDNINSNDSTSSSSSSKPVARPRSSFGAPKATGLGSVLSQLGKKDKLSVLEKSKLDWSSFKQKEGIHEEIETHNKGRDGFLERQDFLQRTDYKQFEIEKSLRQTKRSNR